MSWFDMQNVVYSSSSPAVSLRLDRKRVSEVPNT